MNIQEIDYDGTRFCVIGDVPVLLHNDYDPQQLWLPFMRGAMFAPRKIEPIVEQKLHKPRHKIYVSAEYQRIYPLDAHRDQMVLPFHEKRRVSANERKRLEQAGYPGFERTKDGELITVPINFRQKEKLEAFCVETARGRFAMSRYQFVFEYSEDAMLANMFLDA